MARSVGVPARLATGFIPGEFDQAGGRFIVRERDAHAWAEVWFPETGWVTFDPTAAVPLAGTEEATPGAAAIDWREVGGALLLLVGLGALLGGPVRRRLCALVGRGGPSSVASPSWSAPAGTSPRKPGSRRWVPRRAATGPRRRR